MSAKVTKNATAKKSAVAEKSSPKSAAKKSPAKPVVAEKSNAKSATAKKSAKVSLFEFVGAWLQDTGATESVCGRWVEKEKEFKSMVKKTKAPAKGKKDPAAPKRASSPYIYFSNDKRQEAKEALIEEGEEKPSIGQVSKRLGEMWKEVTPKEKAKYEKMSAKDKVRYEEQKASYTPSEEYAKAGGKKKKDPNAPKRGKSAYMFFSQDKRTEAKEALIEEGEEKPALGLVSKRLGEMWKEVTPKEKAKYEKMAAKDKKRYEDEKAEYTPPAEDAEEEKPKTKGKGKAKAKKEEEEGGEEEGGEEEGGEEEGGEEEGGEEEEAPPAKPNKKAQELKKKRAKESVDKSKRKLLAKKKAGK